MSIEADISTPAVSEDSGPVCLAKISSVGLQQFLEESESLQECLVQLAGIGTEKTSQRVARLVRQLESFEPGVTMIGQVKAGKTSLVNSLVGWPELLPSDVNPWTSVVTSLHMNPKPNEDGNSALFRFFDEAEWNRLLNKGGRVGELASRAGADDELENVRQQIEQMREKSKARLGKRFEMLLGQEHDYGYFDKDLIERYVCLGDDFEDDDGGSDTQGRFADITRSAELFMHSPGLDTRLCIRDTPGVNDTFMMREQITIGAIRGSRLCVLVLSAHQALSSVDMALIRLISNIKSRDVIIFVNRIDELSDPATQVPEIRASIQKTLKDHQGPADAQIIFGSAFWANAALTGTFESLTRESADALFNWAEAEMQHSTENRSTGELVWTLSGVPDLQAAIYDRIAEGEGKELLESVARSAINLTNEIHANNRIISPHSNVTPMERAGKDEIVERITRIEQQSKDALKAEFEKLSAGFHARADGAHKSFLDRATASLIKHLETHGDKTVWQYDSTGLRVLLRSSFQMFGARATRATSKVYDQTANDLLEIYARAFGNLSSEFCMEPPVAPRIPPPVFLGQTIALDMQGGWWKSWWKRQRGYKAFAGEFLQMIREESEPMVDELKNGSAKTLYEDSRQLLAQFVEEQRDIILGVVEQMASGTNDRKTLLGAHSQESRKNIVETSLTTFHKFVA